MNRDTVLQIINQQKDKMTSEQLWCVVLLSGAFGALILNSSGIASLVPAWVVILLSVLAAAWGITFVWSRHKNYMELQEKFRIVREVRGKGLMIGVEMRFPVKDILFNGLERGLLLLYAGRNVLRFLPPLVISRDQIDKVAVELIPLFEQEEKARTRRGAT